MKNPFCTIEEYNIVRDILTPTKKCKTKEFIPYDEGELVVCFEHEEIHYYNKNDAWYICYHQPNWFRSAKDCLEEDMIRNIEFILDRGKNSIPFKQIGINKESFKF